MRKLLILLAIPAAAAVLAVPALASTTQIKIGDNYFGKKGTTPTITVKRGTTVKWTWTGTAPHNVTVTKGPVKFHSKPAITKGSFIATPHTPGRYEIVCTIHQPAMRMTLIVK